MTEGLYPPEGTPARAWFYLRAPYMVEPFIAEWVGNAPTPFWRVGSFNAAQHGAADRDWTILCRVPDSADLLRHEQRVQELLEANNRLVDENRTLREAVRKAASGIAADMIAARPDAEPLVPIRRRDGEPPCGECHLQPGEVCDICGAQAEPPPVDQGAHIQAYAEGSAAAMAGVDWCANPYRQPALSAEWNRGWQEQVKARVARELDDRLITRDEAARWLEGGWPHEPAPERQGPRSQGDAATPLASGNADTAGPGASPAA